ncbi:MAG: EAL domain-containing protein [Halioglobus sp.]|nr:EAL domain-containing protein [Halioglobus sp.]
MSGQVAEPAPVAETGSVTGRSLFTRLVDSAIPREMRNGDPDVLRRARIILSFTLILIVLGIETVIFFALVLSPNAVLRISLLLVVALILTMLIPVAFRRWGSLSLAANLINTAAYIVTVAIYTVLGGIQAPLIHWLALFPMLAALMGARSSAWVWAFISFSTVAFFIWADASNLEFVDAFGITTLEGPTLWLQRSVNVISWLLILLAVALLFEDSRNRHTDQLAAKNAELQSLMEQRHKAEQRSQYLAYYDELTGLPNRRLFLEQLTAAIDQAPRMERTLGLIFLDLDRFKEVNDIHGHALGDQLLRQVADRLRSCVRQSDRLSHGQADEYGNVARLGGDEFTILLNGIRGYRDAAVVAQRILDTMENSFLLGELEIFIGTSIGIALLSGEDTDAGDLLRNADLAMYQAKSTGKNNFKFHEASMNAEIKIKTSMTDALRKALEEDKLELHYQPIIGSQTQNISGVEGLVRWPQAENDYVPTDTLIQVAEESGLIIPLGNWVIHEACRQFSEWRAAGIEPPRVAINVSAEQFRRDSVVETVDDALRKFDMGIGTLEIEITEGAMMIDEDRTLEALEVLKVMGVKIALDDFGTGYSSLSYVHRYPVDALKVDRSFVTDIGEDPGSRAIATSVIALAKELGLNVVGEGVETTVQERFLLEHGCDELQGFLYSKPLPASEMTKILQRGEASRSGLYSSP